MRRMRDRTVVKIRVNTRFSSEGRRRSEDPPYGTTDIGVSLSRTTGGTVVR